MKTVLAIISVLVFSFNVTAQLVGSSDKYIWKNEKTTISAAIQIYGGKQSTSSYCIFYLNSVDTVYNNISDSLFNAYVNLSSLKCPIVKVSFYNNPDTISETRMKLYAAEFSNSIIADVMKKLPAVKSNNFIVSGIDFFAAVVLYASSINANKINKTALFLNETDNAALLKNIGLTEIKKLKGKLYLYVNHQHKEKLFADTVATNIALNSNIVLYKFDHFGTYLSSNIFSEAYNWLLADGNNYIIRDEY